MPAKRTTRHGLNTRNRSPNRTLANASPTQKSIRMNVGARLSSAEPPPAKPDTITTTSSNSPATPQASSTARAPSSRPRPPGSGRHGGSWSRGAGHRAASAANDATSTIAAAQPNSHSGIGRLVRWTSPCAYAAVGTSTAAAATAPAASSATRARRLTGRS